jgi:trehalose 6-phosphate phosphatase
MIAERKPEEISDRFEFLKDRIEEARRIGVFLDFDGTLSDIVPIPGDAKLDPKIKPLLGALASNPTISVGILSGRSLQDLQARVGIEGLIYVGNHGLEIEAGEMRFRDPEAEALRRELKCVSLQLQLALDGVEGMEIEDKGLTLSVHFRRVNEDMQNWVRDTALETATKSRSFTGREGKKVVEVRPRLAWDKGHALKWLSKEVLPGSTLLIYIGDDVTDEDAFAAIPQGITIRVGGTPEAGTRAQYVLPDVPSVARFLSWLNQAKSNASIANAQRVGK